MTKDPHRGASETSEIASLRARVLELERALETAGRALPRLRENEEKYRSALEVAVDGVIVIDAEGLIDSFNPAAAKMFGYEPGEVLGENVSLLMAEPDSSQHDGYLRQFLRTGVAKVIGLGREVVGRRRDGTCFPMELAVSELRSGGRRLFTGITRDISKRRRAEEEARTAQQQLLELREAETERIGTELQKVQHQLVSQERLTTLGQITASIAHELRSPLAGVHNAAHLIRGRVSSSDPKLTRYVDWVDQGVFAADRIIGNLLETTRSSTATPQRIDLVKLIGKLWTRLRRSDAFVLDVAFDPDPLMVFADPLQISQVLNNLIANAIEAMRDAGTVRIVGYQVAGETCVEVHDCGPGIEETKRSKIFEPLYTTKSRGIGLGLSVCRELMLSNKGSLELMETNEGAGFLIRLPIVEDGEHVG